MFLTSSARFMTTWFDAVGTKLSFVMKTEGLSFLRLRLTVFFFVDVKELFGCGGGTFLLREFTSVLKIKIKNRKIKNRKIKNEFFLFLKKYIYDY